MSNIFTKIIEGEEPAHTIWEGNSIIAILDIAPVNPGHILVIPYEEVEDIFDLDDSRYKDLWSVVTMLSKPLRVACSAPKIGIAVEGFGVPHVHIHMVPVYKPGDLNPQRAEISSENKLERMCQKIRDQL